MDMQCAAQRNKGPTPHATWSGLIICFRAVSAGLCFTCKGETPRSSSNSSSRTRGGSE